MQNASAPPLHTCTSMGHPLLHTWVSVQRGSEGDLQLARSTTKYLLPSQGGSMTLQAWGGLGCDDSVQIHVHLWDRSGQGCCFGARNGVGLGRAKHPYYLTQETLKIIESSGVRVTWDHRCLRLTLRGCNAWWRMQALS